VRATLRNPPPPFAFRKADCAPFVVGVNVTVIVQTAWPTNELPQLLVMANWPRAEPALQDIERSLMNVSIEHLSCALTLPQTRRSQFVPGSMVRVAFAGMLKSAAKAQF
jgi:hypothetical protein